MISINRMRMTPYRWLLFDADGTLFDYDHAEKQVLAKTFEQIGYPYEPQYLIVYGDINTQLWLDFEQGQITQEKLKTRRFELLIDAINIPANPQEFSAKYLVNLADGTYLIDGAEDLLRSLWENFHIGIITNGLTEVQRPRFEKSVIRPYISAIVISEEVGAAKPDKQIFEIAFEKMNHPAKHEVLLIGDSLTSDIQGGKNYGIDTCWFNPGRKPNNQMITSTFEIQKLHELLGILELPTNHTKSV